VSSVPASLDRLQFAPPQPPGMLRAFALAVVAHLLLMAALTWGISWNKEPQTTSVEAELWSTLPQEAAPRRVEPPSPPPVPAPVPAPPPVAVTPEAKPEPQPAPREADIALEREKEKEKKAEARRKQLALEREQKREAERELAAKKKAEAEKRLEAQRQLDARKKQELAKAKAAEEKQQKLELSKRQQQAEDAKRIEAQREDNLKRMQGLAGATGPQEAKGTAVRSSGPSASYAGRVAARVKPNIVFTEEIAGNPRAEVEVRTSPDGTIIGQRILKSSGVRGWDEAVLKAVIKTEVLPRDVDGRVPSPLIIDFRPKD
jgi:colicin import membrane protein